MNNINERMTALELSIPAEYLKAPIWLAWVCDGWSDESRGKKNKKVLFEDGRLGHISKKDDMWFEQLMTFEDAVIRLQEESASTWWDCGVGLYNYRGLTIGVVDVDDKAHDAEFGGIKETSVSGDYHYIGLAVVERSYDWAGGQVIGDGGKWIALTGRILGGQWGELRLPERLSSGGHISPASSVEALREAFLASKQGNRHNALYAYCRAVQCALIASDTRDVGIYTAVIKKTVLAHPEYSKDWNWQQTALNIWQSRPHDSTVIAHVLNQVEAQAVDAFAVVSPEEVQKLVKDYVPTQQAEKKKRNLFADGDPYLSLIQAVYQPKKLVRDIFNRKAMMLIEESETEKERWVPITDTSVEQTLKAAVGRLGMEDKVNKTDILANLYWLENRGIDWGLRVSPPEWDGVDRLAVMAHSLNPKDARLTPQAVEYFIKDWVVRAVSRMHDHTVPNRVILFQGAQKIGKDEFFRTLTNGFGPYYIEPSLPNKFKISEEILARSIFDKAVCLFDEFDKLEGSEAIFKSLVTKQELAFDQKFERNIQSFKHRCSYIASCNPAKILKDTTGNRRFVLIQLQGTKGNAIRFNFPYGTDALEYGEQILAQGFALREEFGDGLPEVAEYERIMEDILEAHTPVSEEATVLDAFREAVENYCHDYNREFYVWKTMTELKPLLMQVADALEMDLDGVRKLLEDAGAITPKTRKLRIGGKTVRWHGLPEVLSDRELLLRAERHDWGSRELEPQKVEHGFEIVTAFPEYKQ